MMKTTTFALLVMVLHILKVHTNNQFEAIERCINLTEIDEGLVHEIGIDLVISDDDVIKSFITCLNKEMGFRDDDGVMQFHKIRESLIGLSEEEVDTVIGTCEHVRGIDDTDTTYLVTKCIFKEIRNILNL